MAVAIDLVKREILFCEGDNAWITAFTGVPLDKDFFPAASGNGVVLTFNFGEESFKWRKPNSSFRKLVDLV